MIEFVKNRYVIAYSLIYIFVLTIVVINNVFPLEEILSRLVIIGIIFSIIAYLLSKSSKPIFSVKKKKKSIYQIKYTQMFSQISIQKSKQSEFS